MTTQELREAAKLLTQSRSWRDLRLAMFAYAGSGPDPVRSAGRYDMLAYLERLSDLEEPKQVTNE